MPFLYLLPFAAGALGFGAGFWSGSGVGKVAKFAAIGGGCYLTYKLVKEAK